MISIVVKNRVDKLLKSFVVPGLNEIWVVISKEDLLQCQPIGYARAGIFQEIFQSLFRQYSKLAST